MLLFYVEANDILRRTAKQGISINTHNSMLLFALTPLVDLVWRDLMAIPDEVRIAAVDAHAEQQVERADDVVDLGVDRGRPVLHRVGCRGLFAVVHNGVGLDGTVSAHGFRQGLFLFPFGNVSLLALFALFLFRR